MSEVRCPRSPAAARPALPSQLPAARRRAALSPPLGISPCSVTRSTPQSAFTAFPHGTRAMLCLLPPSPPSPCPLMRGSRSPHLPVSAALPEGCERSQPPPVALRPDAHGCSPRPPLRFRSCSHLHLLSPVPRCRLPCLSAGLGAATAGRGSLPGAGVRPRYLLCRAGTR